MFRRHFENVPIFRPDVEAASHAAIRADRLRFPDAVFPHRLFRLGDLKNSAVARLWFNTLDYLDHAGEGGFPQ